MLTPLLVLIPLDAVSQASLAAQFQLIMAHDQAGLDDACARCAPAIRVVLTNGATGLSAATMARLPNLVLVGCLGVGYENVALDAARARAIVVSNGAGTNDDCVADHAFALLLAVVRRIPQLDRMTRQGRWRDGLPLQPNFSGKKLGIVGLGQIGTKVAQRALAFNLTVGYHNRRVQAASRYAYFDSLLALAAWADYLVLATPGGAGTRHLVNGAVLQALGAGGYLVNVARGSVVDTQALSAALAGGVIADAGLDVYEGEPAPPAALINADNVVLTPHVGGRSPEAVANCIALFLRNASRCLAGQPVLTPIT